MPLTIQFTTDDGGNDRVSVEGSVEDAVVTVTVQRHLPVGTFTRNVTVSPYVGPVALAVVGDDDFDLDEDEDTLNVMPA